MLLCATPAQAGAYRVWTCQTPDGKPAPIRDSSFGWTTYQRENTEFLTLDDRCATGGGIHGHLGGLPYRRAGGSWNFVPPPGTSLGAYSVTWKGTVSGGGEATLSRSDKPDPEYPDRNVGGPFGPGTIAEGAFDIASISLIAACSFVPDGTQCGADPVDFTVSRAVMTLNDLTAPLASDVSGDLVSGAPLRGAASVSFAGRDTGGGLYRVVVTADGADVASAPVPDASGRCVNVDPKDVHAFKWPQPCPLEVRTSVAFDSAALPEGEHVVGVYLEDAAGNRAPLAAPAARTIVHRGASNGGDGALLKRTGRYTVTTSFAKRRPTLRGTLTRNGAPVAGALVDVLSRIRTSGAHMSKIAETRTDAQGNYRVKVPGGPSRLLRVAYKAYLGDQSYATWTDVSQRVRARVEMNTRTLHVALRGTARFSGRVRGGYVPRRGKLIELQAYDAGRWRTFRTVRTHRNGRFAAAYSFKHVNAPRGYRFRARARYEPGYPFLLGVSSATRVRVG